MKNRQHGSLTITFPTEYNYLLLAMESTGTYWQSLFAAFAKWGFTDYPV